MTLLRASGIAVRDGATTLVAPIDLALVEGEPLVVLGETGSGKSLLAQALMGTLPPNLTVQGRVAIGDRLLDAADRAAFRGLWGRAIAVLPQEPWLSLDPLMRARAQVAEGHRLVRGLAAKEARARGGEDLAALGLAGAVTRYPHELSGGMAQRVAIAAARAGGARIVLADEPSKGLDAARRDEVARLLGDALAQGGGLLVITHDLALARMIGGRLIVLREGALVECGRTAEVFAAPQAAYTRDLVAADPEHWPQRERPVGGTGAVVKAEDLTLSRGGRQLFSGLGFSVAPGQVLGITGPSGCGKSSLGDAVLGLIRPDAGRVHRAPGTAPTAFQKLYQDPVAAFPRKRQLGSALADVARLHKVATGRVDDLLARLSLDPVLLQRYPDTVSGGELQRLALLRVMLAQPRFIFADEPTSRLDPITQRQVIEVLIDVAWREKVAIMIVSHDLALIRKTADHSLLLGEPATPDLATRVSASVLASAAPSQSV